MNDEQITSEDGLTQEERTVLKLVAEGKSLEEIGTFLGVTEQDARSHRKNIMKQLNLHSFTDLTQYAAQIGLVSSEERFSKRLDVGLTGKAIFTSFGRPVDSRVTVKDLSAHGAYLVSSSSPSVGDPVQVHLHREKPKISFEAEGTVTRVERLSEGEHGIAVQFQTIPDLAP